MALVDEQIQDALRSGHFTDLPGAGKPLKLDDDPNTPPHLRMAYKLLRDNDYVPDWIAQGQQIDAARDKLRVEVRRAAGDGAVAELLRALVQQYNRQVLSYNLKVPQGVAHKRHFDLDRELQKAK